MKRNLIIIASVFYLSLGLTMSTFAQFNMTFGPDLSFYGTNDQELAKAALKKKMIVILDEITPKKEKKLKKKGKYDEAKKQMDDDNAKLVAFFKNGWKSNEIVTQTETEFNTFKKTKDPNYIYFKKQVVTDRKNKKNMLTGIEVRVTYTYHFLTVSDISKKGYIAGITTSCNRLNDYDVEVSLIMLQNLMKEAANGHTKKEYVEEVNKEAATLKSKTLLIPDYYTKLTIDEIKANYPYPVELCKEQFIREKIAEKNNKYAFVLINHKYMSVGTKYNHIAIDIDKMSPVLIDRRSDIGFGSMTGYTPLVEGPISIGFPYDININAHQFVTKKQLKDYIELIDIKK